MPNPNIVSVTPFLRNVLLLDGLVSGAAGLLMVLGATIIAPLTGLPMALLAWAGAVMLPWCFALVVMARRATIPRLWLIEVVAINALWVAASFGLLLSGAIEPTILGYGFVIAQAMAVILFAELQIIGLRRNRAATA